MTELSLDFVKKESVMDRIVFNQIRKKLDGEVTAGVMAVIVSTEESSPRGTGARMLYLQDGSIKGTIGGGSLESKAVEICKMMISGGIPHRLEVFDLGKPGEGDRKTGMICGGNVTVYFELISAETRFIVFGAGHIGAILSKLAAQCGYRVKVIDHREEFANPALFDSGIEVINENPIEYAAGLDLRSSDSIVILTHKHVFDYDVLRELLSGDKVMPMYLGMIGSRTKVEISFGKLAEAGIESSKIDAVHSPVGLDIGADRPAELAVAILAEALSVRSGKISDGGIRLMRR